MNSLITFHDSLANSLCGEFKLIQVRRIGKTITGGTPSTGNSEYWEGGEIPWLQSGKLQNCDIHFEDVEKFITASGLVSSAAKLIPSNCPLVALTGATCANVGFLNFDSTANQSVVAIDVKKYVSPRFLYWALLSQRQQILIEQSGGAQGGIDQSDVKGLKIPCPTTIGQSEAIADFLDRETARIDGLIEKEQRLLALLEEKRTALISHAVTKGLNPDAELKDSGIEWLGQIPKEWEVKKLKYCSQNIKTGGTPPTEYIVPDGELDWFTPGDFDGALYLGNSKRRLSQAASDDKVVRFFPERSILIIGIGATLGKVALTEKKCSANQQINFVVPSADCSPEFLVYFLSLHRETMRLLSDSATLGIMNQEKTGLLPIPCPSKEQQEAIVEYVHAQTARFDALKTKITRAIELLREKRTALISAAVTGKIEVKEDGGC